MDKHIEIWIDGWNPKYDTHSNVAYYDESSADLAEIIKDLEANQYKIWGVDYSRKGSVDVFTITVV